MNTQEFDRDLVEHAREQLGAAAQRYVRGGRGPASAARLAIRETQTLFPQGWKLGVQGGDDEEFVEVWEVEHKYAAPIATVRGSELEQPAKLNVSQRNALGFMLRRPYCARGDFPKAAGRTLDKLVARRLVTVHGDRYTATEAGEVAYFATEEQA